MHSGGRSTTQTILLYKNQQTQLSILHELELLVRRMLVMFQRSITLLSRLIFLLGVKQELRKYSSGESLTKDTPQGDKDCVNPEFKYMNKLSCESKPWESTDTFIPIEHKKKSADDYFSFGQMTECTNIKAVPAGTGSTMYTDDWKPFTAAELGQIVGLYVLEGLLLPTVYYVE